MVGMGTKLGARHAFTLIELLVVIAIIGIVTSLALPAVQSARESSRRTFCNNHIRQIALGVIKYESQYRHFPSGGWGKDWLGSEGRAGREQPGGWVYAVLPFVEEQVLYDSIAASSNGNASGYDILCGTSVGLFSCPTRRVPAPLPLHPSKQANYLTEFHGNRSDGQFHGVGDIASRTDYCFNGGSVTRGGGVNEYAAVLPAALHAQSVTICSGGADLNVAAGDLIRGGSYDNDDTLGACNSGGQAVIAATPNDFQEGDAWRRQSAQTLASATFGVDYGLPALGNGLVHRMSEVAAGNVLDGLSNVYLIGEKYVNSEHYESGEDPGDDRPMMVGFSSSTIRWAWLPPQADGPIDLPKIFGSAHSGIWNAAFGDGSVRSLSFDIDPETHRNLAARSPRYAGEILAGF